MVSSLRWRPVAACPQSMRRSLARSNQCAAAGSQARCTVSPTPSARPSGQPQRERRTADARLDQGVRAEVLRRDHPRRHASIGDPDGLGPQAQRQALDRAPGRRRLQDRRRSGQALERDDVHGRRADEAGGEDRRRAPVKVRRRGVLLDAPVPHQDDLVGHGHGLDLVVGDVEHRDAEPLLQRPDLAAHLHAKLRVEVRQGLVHQADRRPGDDGAPQRDALLLAARELRRLAVEKRLEPEEARGVSEPRLALRRRLVAHLEAEDDVLRDREVGKEGVVLEDHGDAAPGRRQPGHVAPADRDGSGARGFEPRDEAERRRLAAARRPEQRDEGAGRRGEAHAVHGRGGAPELGDVLQSDVRPARPAWRAARRRAARVRAGPRTRRGRPIEGEPFGSH